MKKNIAFVLCTVLIIVFTGCAANVTLLTGEWKLSDALEQQARMNNIEIADPILVFEENNKFIYNVVIEGSIKSIYGTYSFVDNKVTLNLPGEAYAYDSGTPMEDPVYDFVKKDDESYSLQMQGEDTYIKN